MSWNIADNVWWYWIELLIEWKNRQTKHCDIIYGQTIELDYCLHYNETNQNVVVSIMHFELSISIRHYLVWHYLAIKSIYHLVQL